MKRILSVILAVSFILCILVSLQSCSRCEHHFQSERVKEPTCAVEGEKKLTCTLCGHEEYVPILATGQHSYTEEIITPATPESTGLKTQTCRVCGYSQETTIEKVKSAWYKYNSFVCGVFKGTCRYAIGGNYYSKTCSVELTMTPTMCVFIQVLSGDTVFSTKNDLVISIDSNSGYKSFRLGKVTSGNFFLLGSIENEVGEEILELIKTNSTVTIEIEEQKSYLTQSSYTFKVTNTGLDYYLNMK